MIKIQVINLAKQFKNNLLFKNINTQLCSGDVCAVTGANGTGKSTFLQIMANFISPSIGEVKYFDGEQSINENNWYNYFSFAAPYLELVEEFTAIEQINFHTKFKRLTLDSSSLLNNCGLSSSKDKRIDSFSSGMKQRLKLALAFYSDTPVLFLDEPTSNLDKDGINWYQYEMKNIMQMQKLIVIASNDENEYKSFATQQIAIDTH